MRTNPGCPFIFTVRKAVDCGHVEPRRGEELRDILGGGLVADGDDDIAAFDAGDRADGLAFAVIDGGAGSEIDACRGGGTVKFYLYLYIKYICFVNI